MRQPAPTETKFSMRLHSTDTDRLDRLVAAVRARHDNGIPKVTRSSALRELLRDWDTGNSLPPRPAR